jgi:O-antigen ligase
MITDTSSTAFAATAEQAHVKRPFVLVPLIFALFFVQFWGTVRGFTVRSEDVLIIVALGIGMIGILISERFRYRRSPLDLALFAWMGTIGIGVLLTLVNRELAATHRDALVNGVRLALASTLFWLTYWHPASFATKARALISVTLGVGSVTTVVSLLQIGYWDGWLPFALPAVLTEMAEGANAELGREIFGLYIGNTGAHAWSGMVAMQALLVWLLAWRAPTWLWRVIYGGAFIILCLILVRMSVRASIVGLFLSMVGVATISAVFSRYSLNRIVGVIVVPTTALLALSALFVLAPQDAFFVERIRQAIPQFDQGQLTISRASNIFGRLDYIAIAWQLFLERPILGNGFWSFTVIASAIYGRTVAHTHNSYIQALTEMGVVGFAALLWLVGAMMVLFWQSRTLLQRGGEQRLYWQWALGGVSFLLLTAFVANPFWNPVTLGFRFVLLGLVASALREEVVR